MSHAIQAKLEEIARRYKRKRYPISMGALRVTELQRLRRARYPQGIPDTPNGRVLVRVIVHHLAGLVGDQHRRVTGWLAEHASWMTLADQKALLVEIATKPRRWRADRLAWRLKLIEADRKKLRITTIGAIDVNKTNRLERRKAHKRDLEQDRRNAKGAMSRAEYEANSINRAQPWLAQGISRRTWYRRRGTSP